MKALFGYTGFVGSNLLLKEKFDYLYNSKNIIEAINKEFDIIYFCAIPATKWLANKNPNDDIKNILQIINILDTIKCNKFILISTIDVYLNIDDNSDEDSSIHCELNHPYGKYRYIFEQYIMDKFDDYHIFRLPALFGHGLKKNIIYDLLNNNLINNIPTNSSFQWYNLDWLYDDIKLVINNNIDICNLFTQPLDSYNIIKLFDYPLDKFHMDQTIEYNLKTKYHQLFKSSINGYIRDSDTILNDIKKFISYSQINKNQLCISNICSNLSHQHFASIIKTLGINNIEIAPTKLSSWDNLSDLNLSYYQDLKLNVYSFQSISYGLKDLNIFTETKDDFLKHLYQVIDIASKNNVKVLVFGCPKNRKIENFELNNRSIAIDFFRDLGDYCNDKNIIICLEPNSKKYNCNFLNNIKETESITREINHKNIKMMIDLGNAIMEEDNNIINIADINDIADIIYHIHISQEYLRNFTNPHIDNYKFTNMLREIKYDKMITLEMLNPEDDLELLKLSIINFVNIYGN